MRLKLAKLQESNTKAWKIKAEELKESLDKYIDVNGVLYHQDYHLYLNYNDFLAIYFDIDKIRELIG